MNVRQQITALTIGVDDLERSLAFYRDGLGFQTNGIIGTEFKGDDDSIPQEPLSCLKCKMD